MDVYTNTADKSDKFRFSLVSYKLNQQYRNTSGGYIVLSAGDCVHAGRMTRTTVFSEAFWDNDLSGVAGWETLLKRMKDGRTLGLDIAHFFKDRAKAEADYSKALYNLAKKAGEKGTGRLGEGWRVLKIQTENIATSHEEASVNLNQLHEELMKFLDDQKQTVKQWETIMKKQIQSKKSEHQKTMNLKKSYENKCVELNNAQENVKTAMASVTVKKTDIEKAQDKKEKCTDARNNADVAYKSAIETLEAVRQAWINDMEKCCKVFEEQDSRRIEVLRDKLWQFTNVESLTCVKHDDCAEKVRVVLEICDVNGDVQEFIDKYQTGSKRPDPILYENYYNLSQGSTNSKRPQMAASQVNTLSRQGPTRPQAPPAQFAAAADDGAYATVDRYYGKTTY